MQKNVRLVALLAAGALCMSIAQAQSLAPLNADGVPLGALAPKAIKDSKVKPGFDITGTWLHAGGQGNPWQFAPPQSFKLTPEAQVHYDAAKKAQAEGKVYRDDIGACWPAGLPIIMTRVWPIAMIQKPTVIFMISGFMNETRIIYTDGRQHTDPEVVIPSFNGESIGHWEGDTLVVDTTGFVGDHHWIDNGVPASDQLHVIERMKLIDGGETLQIEYTMTDPKSWVGEWQWTKKWRRTDDLEITEAHCLPDLNEHLLSTGSSANVR